MFCLYKYGGYFRLLLDVMDWILGFVGFVGSILMLVMFFIMKEL